MAKASTTKKAAVSLVGADASERKKALETAIKQLERDYGAGTVTDIPLWWECWQWEESKEGRQEEMKKKRKRGEREGKGKEGRRCRNEENVCCLRLGYHIKNVRRN